MNLGKLYVLSGEEYVPYDDINVFLNADPEQLIYVNCGGCRNMKLLRTASEIEKEDQTAYNYVCDDCEIGNRTRCPECNHKNKHVVDKCKCGNLFCCLCMKTVPVDHDINHVNNQYSSYYGRLSRQYITYDEVPDHFKTRKMLIEGIKNDKDARQYYEQFHPTTFLRIMTENVKRSQQTDLSVYKEYCKEYVTDYYNMSEIDKNFFNNDEYYEMCVIAMRQMTCSLLTIKCKFPKIYDLYEEAIKRIDFSLTFINPAFLTKNQLKTLHSKALEINPNLIREIVSPNYDQYLIAINKNSEYLSIVQPKLINVGEYYNLCRYSVINNEMNLKHVVVKYLTNKQKEDLCNCAISQDIMNRKKNSNDQNQEKTRSPLKFIHLFELPSSVYIKMCEHALNYNGFMLCHIIPHIYYEMICSYAIKKNPFTLKYVNYFCLDKAKYRELCSIATDKNFRTFTYVVPEGVDKSYYDKLKLIVCAKSSEAVTFVKNMGPK